ncbi:hypothetical protein [Spiroplasma poulsonii]|uniref:hypothetical protein n=1 Tax=Spiroplasma poulsonii TaxID=2138 RepID=UPI001F4D1F87|nr:hypothetical protein [Spiroplasma poulsonii]UNF62348.1 hypothetical protein MNU24_02475 [Spiroplasma poulsonii]
MKQLFSDYRVGKSTVWEMNSWIPIILVHLKRDNRNEENETNSTKKIKQFWMENDIFKVKPHTDNRQKIVV